MKINPNYKAVCERFLEIRTAFNKSQAEFTKNLYILSNNYGQVELGKRKPTITLILAVMVEYNVNPVWLLLGKGEMFDKSLFEENLVTESEVKYNIQQKNMNELDRLRQVISAQTQTITTQKKLISLLEKSKNT